MLDLKAFQCPNCQQFINNSMSSCKFCAMPLDMQTISNAVVNQHDVTNAYSLASTIRVLAGLAIMLYFLSYIPFIGFLIYIVHWLVFLAVPVLLIVWLIQYSGLRTTDPEFKEAQKFCLTAFFMWIGLIVLRVVLFILLVAGLIALQNR